MDPAKEIPPAPGDELSPPAMLPTTLPSAAAQSGGKTFDGSMVYDHACRVVKDKGRKQPYPKGPKKFIVDELNLRHHNNNFCKKFSSASSSAKTS